MSKLLVISYSGFSDSNANGKTLKALLCKWKNHELAQFYCGAEFEDTDFCSTFFHVTDKQMLKSFYKKKNSRVVNANKVERNKEFGTLSNTNDNALSSRIRKYNYNFFFRTLREYLWKVAPWGKREYREWVSNFSPSAIFYMVGESWFMDKLVLKTAKRHKIPIILYNCEAYRIVNPKDRKGFDRYYYKKVEKSYRKLIKSSQKIIYNCEFLMDAYQKKYGVHNDELVVHNSSSFDTSNYEARDGKLKISYFGNLGVGRVPSLIKVADALNEIKPELSIDVYGKVPNKEDECALNNHPSINFCGLVAPEKLVEIKEESDVLLHVESFEESIAFKLRYAFSTKIAQYLCAGRSVLTYAPAGTASTKYLQDEGSALVATNEDELKEYLKRIVEDPSLRQIMSQRAAECAHRNHDMDLSAEYVRKKVEE